MDPRNDIGFKILIVILFMVSTTCTVLWMTQNMNDETVLFKQQSEEETSILSEEVVDLFFYEPQDEVPVQRDSTSSNIFISQLEEDLFEDNFSHHLQRNLRYENSFHKILEEQDKPLLVEENIELAMLGEMEVIPVTTEQQGIEHANQVEQEDFHLEFDIAWDLFSIEQDLALDNYPTEKVVATGYTAGYESTGKNPGHPSYGITYSGVEVRRDLYSTIAADINVFPIGTILYIPNYGYGVVADIGGAIRGNKIDLYFETVDDVYQFWGKKEIDVYVIEKGNGSLNETVLDHLNENETMQVYSSKE